MERYSLDVFSGSGEILSRRFLEVRDVSSALARANCRARAIARGLRGAGAATPSHIDVSDEHGQAVARVLWSETIAAMT